MAKFGVVKSELPLEWERALGDSLARTARVGRSYLNFMSRRVGVDKQDTRASTNVITKLGQDMRELFKRGEIAVERRLKEEKGENALDDAERFFWGWDTRNWAKEHVRVAVTFLLEKCGYNGDTQPADVRHLAANMMGHLLRTFQETSSSLEPLMEGLVFKAFAKPSPEVLSNTAKVTGIRNVTEFMAIVIQERTVSHKMSCLGAGPKTTYNIVANMQTATRVLQAWWKMLYYRKTDAKQRRVMRRMQVRHHVVLRKRTLAANQFRQDLLLAHYTIVARLTTANASDYVFDDRRKVARAGVLVEGVLLLCKQYRTPTLHEALWRTRARILLLQTMYNLAQEPSLRLKMLRRLVVPVLCELASYKGTSGDRRDAQSFGARMDQIRSWSLAIIASLSKAASTPKMHSKVAVGKAEEAARLLAPACPYLWMWLQKPTVTPDPDGVACPLGTSDDHERARLARLQVRRACCDVFCNMICTLDGIRVFTPGAIAAPKPKAKAAAKASDTAVGGADTPGVGDDTVDSKVTTDAHPEGAVAPSKKVRKRPKKLVPPNFTLWSYVSSVKLNRMATKAAAGMALSTLALLRNELKRRERGGSGGEDILRPLADACVSNVIVIVGLCDAAGHEHWSTVVDVFESFVKVTNIKPLTRRLLVVLKQSRSLAALNSFIIAPTAASVADAVRYPRVHCLNWFCSHDATLALMLSTEVVRSVLRQLKDNVQRFCKTAPKDRTAKDMMCITLACKCLGKIMSAKDSHFAASAASGRTSSQFSVHERLASFRRVIVQDGGLSVLCTVGQGLLDAMDADAILVLVNTLCAICPRATDTVAPNKLSSIPERKANDPFYNKLLEHCEHAKDSVVHLMLRLLWVCRESQTISAALCYALANLCSCTDIATGASDAGALFVLCDMMPSPTRMLQVDLGGRAKTKCFNRSKSVFMQGCPGPSYHTTRSAVSLQALPASFFTALAEMARVPANRDWFCVSGVLQSCLERLLMSTEEQRDQRVYGEIALLIERMAKHSVQRWGTVPDRVCKTKCLPVLLRTMFRSKIPRVHLHCMVAVATLCEDPLGIVPQLLEPNPEAILERLLEIAVAENEPPMLRIGALRILDAVAHFPTALFNDILLKLDAIPTLQRIGRNYKLELQRHKGQWGEAAVARSAVQGLGVGAVEKAKRANSHQDASDFQVTVDNYGRPNPEIAEKKPKVDLLSGHDGTDLFARKVWAQHAPHHLRLQPQFQTEMSPRSRSFRNLLEQERLSTLEELSMGGSLPASIYTLTTPMHQVVVRHETTEAPATRRDSAAKRPSGGKTLKGKKRKGMRRQSSLARVFRQSLETLELNHSSKMNWSTDR